MIGGDRFARNSVFRVSKDYRSAIASVRPYPGSHALRTKSHLAEARTNMEFVWNLRGQASRFSDGNWPVLYTAQHRRTAYAEVGYHLQEVYLPAKLAGTEIIVPHIVYRLKVRGKRRDLSFDNSHFHVLCGSDVAALKACQNIARKAISDSVQYLLAPSARTIRSRCYPILDRSAASPPLDAETLDLSLADSEKYVTVKKGFRRFNVGIARHY